MTPDDFRRLALGLPGAFEAAHMGRPDFRVAGRIFAFLGADENDPATVFLDPREQALLLAKLPDVFRPVWSGLRRRDHTHVVLPAANEAVLTAALQLAWRRRAPRRLSRDLPLPPLLA